MIEVLLHIGATYLLIAAAFFVLLWDERAENPDPNITNGVLFAAALLWFPLIADLAVRPPDRGDK